MLKLLVSEPVVGPRLLTHPKGSQNAGIILEWYLHTFLHHSCEMLKAMSGEEMKAFLFLLQERKVLPILLAQRPPAHNPVPHSPTSAWKTPDESELLLQC